MVRFRVGSEDDDDETTPTMFDYNEHYPQNNNNGTDDVPSPQSAERSSKTTTATAFSRFRFPKVSIRRPLRHRSRPEEEENSNDNPNADALVVRPPPSALTTTTALATTTTDDDDDDDNVVDVDQHQYQYPAPAPLQQQQRSSWFRTVLLWAIVSHLLACYGPVSPPPDAQSDSWEDFWVRELRGLWRSAKLVGYTVPKYVLEWVVVGMHEDAQSYWRHYRDYRREQQQLNYWINCSLTIPDTDWNLDYSTTTKTTVTSGTTKSSTTTKNDNEDDNQYQIVGQSRAIRVTTQALDAWTKSSPLLLYFAGSQGVGKMELARQLSRRVFDHCNNHNNNNIIEHDRSADMLSGSSNSPVLILQGRDFATTPASEEEEANNDDETMIGSDDNKNGESTAAAASKERKASTTDSTSKRHVSVRAVRIQLYETIVRHTQLHPNGTVVVLQHAEETIDGLIASLVQDLTNPSWRGSTQDRADTTTTTTNAAATTIAAATPHDSSQESLASRLQQACRKTIVILTSSVGSKTIASSIRRYGGISNISPLEMDLMLMHELDTYYAASSSSTGSTRSNAGSSGNNQKQRPSTVEVGSKFHAVAPFFPLELPSLARILTQKIQQWTRRQQFELLQNHHHHHRHGYFYPSSLEVTPSALNALLDSSHVEYLSMIKKSTQTPLLTFSSAGAHFLREGSPMMNSWQASLKRCYREQAKKQSIEADNKDSFQDDKDSSEDDNEESTQEPESQFDGNAILDYDKTRKDGVLSLCPSSGGGNNNTEATPECEEVCRFQL